MGRAAAQQQQEQHHDSKQSGAAQEDADGPTVENWSNKNQRVIVAAPADGYLFDLQLHAKVNFPPRQVYNILRNTDSPSVFRTIKAVLHREVLEDDGKGRRKIFVRQRALARFLWLTIGFDTELHVWENDEDMTIKFTNVSPDGFMKDFEGTWRIHPFTQDGLDAVFKHPSPQQQQEQQQKSHGSHHALPFLHRLSGGHSQQQQEEASATLVTLEQAMAPRVNPPRLLQPMVRALIGRSLHGMMADLRIGLERQQVAAAAEAAAAGGQRVQVVRPASAKPEDAQAPAAVASHPIDWND